MANIKKCKKLDLKTFWFSELIFVVDNNFHDLWCDDFAQSHWS